MSTTTPVRRARTSQAATQLPNSCAAITMYGTAITARPLDGPLWIATTTLNGHQTSPIATPTFAFAVGDARPPRPAPPRVMSLKHSWKGYFVHWTGTPIC